jgi:hypothetical protein
LFCSQQKRYFVTVMKSLMKIRRTDIITKENLFTYVFT